MSQIPAVSGKQLIKLLEGQGNTPIKRGTLGNILRTVGLSREEFQRLLR